MHLLTLLIYALAGTVLGCFLFVVPSIHFLNFSGVIIAAWMHYSGLFPLGEPMALFVFFMGMVVSFGIMNTVPSMFLGAPDESAVFVVLPGAKYMLQGKGYEAAMLTGVGGLLGIGFLVVFTPFFFFALPKIHKVIGPHMHWILGLIIVYMLMSEWPKGTGKGDTWWQKFKGAWANLFAGIATFALSSFLGFIIFNKTMVPVQMSFQALLPVFVGMFAVSSLISAILSRQEIPPQHISRDIDIDFKILGKGCLPGWIGGLMAAYLPGVTGGIGGLIAGHATAQRDDRIFVMSQGVSKVVYYTGQFLLYFVPAAYFLDGGGLRRGGMAINLSPFYKPQILQEYVFMLGVILVAGCISYLLLSFNSRWVIKLITRVPYQKISYAALVVVVLMVFFMPAMVMGRIDGETLLSGFSTIAIMAVSTCLGLIPIFYHCRRSNCMAVIIVPICLNMAGYGTAIAGFLGLS
ncbi:MAG TPA: tripartite tricarboxylate transporter permease [bacterium]|nr:tripartite tricarboxylate transporter permease [bacterium]HPJ71497.1 tripartite tricarboxylate transporter permease [bacterium]HPQ67203.1 tripartite tricarboxylate transporter permease [bacterium]